MENLENMTNDDKELVWSDDQNVPRLDQVAQKVGVRKGNMHIVSQRSSKIMVRGDVKDLQ